MPISPLPRLAHLTGLSLQIIVFRHHANERGVDPNTLQKPPLEGDREYRQNLRGSAPISNFKLGCSTSQASSNHEVVCRKNNFCSHITLLLRMLRAISLLHHGHSACITKTSQNDPWFVGTSDILSLHNDSSVGFNVFRYKIRIINASRFGARLCLWRPRSWFHVTFSSSISMTWDESNKVYYTRQSELTVHYMATIYVVEIYVVSLVSCQLTKDAAQGIHKDAGSRFVQTPVWLRWLHWCWLDWYVPCLAQGGLL